jgi:hypothetical protein
MQGTKIRGNVKENGQYGFEMHKVSKTNTDNTNLETGIDTKCYGRISIVCPFN